MIRRSLWVLLAAVLFFQQVASQRVFCHHADGTWHLETVGATCCDVGLCSSDVAVIPASTGDPDAVDENPDCPDCTDYAVHGTTMLPVVAVAATTLPEPPLIGELIWPPIDVAKRSPHRLLATPETIRRQSTTILRC